MRLLKSVPLKKASLAVLLSLDHSVCRYKSSCVLYCTIPRSSLGSREKVIVLEEYDSETIRVSVVLSTERIGANEIALLCAYPHKKE